MEVPWETKPELPYDSAIPFLGIYPGRIIIQKDTCNIIFIAVLFTIANMLKKKKKKKKEKK